MQVSQSHGSELWTPRRHPLVRRAAGYSFGASSRGVKKLAGAAVSSFDPATLALSGWWRASFTASPWVSTASAGASSGRQLAEATNPPNITTALNGYDPPNFDGVNDRLVTTVLESDLFTAGAGSAIVLYNADTAVAPQGAANADDGLFQGAGGYFAIGVNTTGPDVRLYQAATPVDIQLTASTGAWVAVQMKWNGATLKARVNSDVWTSSACTDMGDLTSILKVGENVGVAEFFDGRIAEIMSAAVTLSDADCDDIVTGYFNVRYGLSL